MNETLLSKLADAPPLVLLSEFPRIAERLAGLWGQREIEACFQDLMIDGRGDRSGFPPEVLMEILNLRSFHRGLFPPPARTVNTWAELTDRESPAEAPRTPSEAFGWRLVAMDAVELRRHEF